MGRPLPINILHSTRQVICQILKVHNDETSGGSQAERINRAGPTGFCSSTFSEFYVGYSYTLTYYKPRVFVRFPGFKIHNNFRVTVVGIYD